MNGLTIILIGLLILIVVLLAIVWDAISVDKTKADADLKSAGSVIADLYRKITAAFRR